MVILMMAWMMATTSIPYQLYGEQFDFVTTDKNFARDFRWNWLRQEHVWCDAGGDGIVRADRAEADRDAEPGVVTAPTYTMLQDATLRTFFDIGGDLVTDYNKNEHRATMVNGSEVLFRSADNPDRLRGRTSVGIGAMRRRITATR